MDSGIEVIARERERQIRKGFDAEHDNGHDGFELTRAAMSYAAVVASPDESSPEMCQSRSTDDWPWEDTDWNPSNDPIRNLARAGALIAAEIDRLQRKRETVNRE